MTDYSHYSLYKKFKYNSKEDDDMFSIRYHLTDDFQSPHEQENVSSSQNHSVKKMSNIVQHNNNHHNLKPREKKRLTELQNYSKKQLVHTKQKGGKKIQEKYKYNASETGEDQEEIKSVVSDETPLRIDQNMKNIKARNNLINEENDQKVSKSKNSLLLLQSLIDDDTPPELGQLVLKSKRSKSSGSKNWPQVQSPKNKKQKKSRKLYDDYLDEDIIEQSRQNRQNIYFKGRAQFSEEDKWFGKIISDEVEGMLIIQGKHKNRCLHEDEVYFKILQQGKQKILCQVVAIVSNRNKQIVGSVRFQKSKNIYLLKPISKRLESMNLQINQIKKQWLADIHSKYFLAQFVFWGVYNEYPTARIIDEYGQFGLIDIETNALLKTQGVENREYKPQDIQKALDPFKHNINEQGQFILPKQQIASRNDLRKHDIFILRENSYDAAFSIRSVNATNESDPNFLKKNTYEISVHYTDVAYFVGQNSFLDEQLLKRLISLNLKHKTIPLLPVPFIDKICKLKLNRDSLSITVSFQIDEEGNVLQGASISRSIIRPSAIFSYEQLLCVINGSANKQEWKKWQCGCKNKAEILATTKYVQLMNQLLLKSREKRIKSGALIFQTPIKSFKLDAQNSPQILNILTKSEANFLIEQCIIIAGTKVGQYLFKNLKQKAILFRHKFPGYKRLGKFRQLMKKISQPLPSSSSEIQLTINNLVQKGTIKQCIKDLIKYQTIHLLQGADYFQAQNSQPTTWIHYAINVPIYTHCSIPTKRYLDIVSQRQICTVLDQKKWEMQESVTVSLLARCNESLLLWKKIENGCDKILFCTYLKNNPVFTTAILTSVQDWGIKLCVPRFDFKSTIKFAKLKQAKVTKFDTDPTFRKYVKMEYNSQNGQISTNFALKQLQELNVQITTSNSFPLDYFVTLVMPHPTDIMSKLLIY